MISDFYGMPTLSEPGVIYDPDLYNHRIEVRDGHGRYLGDVGDYSDLEWTTSADAEDLEASMFTVPGTSMWSKTMMKANRSVILIHIILYRGEKQVHLWTGRVDRSVRTKEGGQSTIKVELISDKGWLNYLHIWSAPFAPLWFQAPKKRIKVGSSIFIMKQYLIDNLIRLQSSRSALDKANFSLYHSRPHEWLTIQNDMYPLVVIPTPKEEDTSPVTALTVRMTRASEMMSEVCKDYNLLPVVKYFVPGRDPAPPKIHMSRPGVYIDIIDKEKAREGKAKTGRWEEVTSILFPFVRGLFGRTDAPPVTDTTTVEGLQDFFGRKPSDPWVIFRESDKHWAISEVAAYSPTTTSSIAGGRSHDFLNKGITLLANTAIHWALSLIGLGFIGNLITGELDDIFFAYQRANDPDLRSFLGDYAFFEDYGGQGTTAYSMDTAQALRKARWAAIGYKTASFQGDYGIVPPFLPFEDFDLLDPVGWEDEEEGRIIPDRMKKITVRETRSEGVSFEFRIGETERPEEPWEIQNRANRRFKEAIDAAFMAD